MKKLSKIYNILFRDYVVLEDYMVEMIVKPNPQIVDTVQNTLVNGLGVVPLVM